MNISFSQERGLTLVEVLVAIVIIIILGILMFGVPSHRKAPALRAYCLNNLKQVGGASRVWADDNGDKFPWEVAQTNGGTMEFTSGPNLWRHFQVMSNELNTPKILYCLIEESRLPATNFAFLNNSNISYFVNLNATNANSQALLSSDRSLTNGTLIENGILKLAPNQAAGWTDELHSKFGNIALADGSVRQVTSAGLRTAVTKNAAETNHLLMPVLGP